MQQKKRKRKKSVMGENSEKQGSTECFAFREGEFQGSSALLRNLMCHTIPSSHNPLTLITPEGVLPLRGC